MDEEEELDEELRKLDIKEDLGEEDSDVTPTNTPTPPTVVHLPQSSNTSGFFEGDLTRYSSCDDYDMRTNSSLSWGEDEFEGEATRIVTALFTQLDEIIYNDSLAVSAKFPMLKTWLSGNKQDKDGKHRTLEATLESHAYSLQHELSLSESTDDDEAYQSTNRSVNIPPPSEALVAEIKEWNANFEHLRVNGIGINLLHYEQIEAELLPDCNSTASVNHGSSNGASEETIAVDGDYLNKLQFITLKHSYVNKDKRKEKKGKGPPSRICSGSMDPDLLREHVLIKLFDHIWPIVSQIIEPLFNQYAQFVINRSVQFASLSRGSSTFGDRELPHIPSNNLGDAIHSTPKGLPSPRWQQKDRTPLTNSRPSSAMYRLTNSVPSRNIYSDELSSLLQVTGKPIQFNDDRREMRSMSASTERNYSASSQVSLPSLLSLANMHRPVSSKSGNHLLTPMATVEQRPMSTSSFTRLRYTDKYNKLNRTATIDEGSVGEREKDSKDVNLSPTWSRHNSFLPRIDSKSQNTNLSASGLSIRGKSLSARSRISRSDGDSPRKSVHDCR